MAIAILRNDIESALPPTGLLAAECVGEDETGETGRESDILRLHTCSGNREIQYADEAGEDHGQLSMSSSAYDSQLQVGGDMQQIEYELVRDAGNLVDVDFNLLRKVTRNLLAQTEPAPVEQVICRYVVTYNVRYLDGSDWVDSWDSSQQEDTLPPAVEGSLEVKVKDPSETESENLSSYQRSESYESERTRRVVLVLLLPCSTPPDDGGNRFIR